ncbi:MAG: single-stranded DNA-binding protein [Flavobacteriaceae bacterium]|nr:single-stranded DNA-binding protein [Flavobacteriaceae bacterium]
MRSMKNSVSLIGRIGNPAEIKKFQKDKKENKVANFSVATSYTYTNSEGEKIENTQWHRIVAWDKLADIVEKYTGKGSEIGIEGQLTHRSYEDEDGTTKYITEVIANEVLLFGGKKD